MKNILLYLSAFVPMYVLILVKQIIEMLVGNIKTNFLDMFVVVLLVLVIVFGLIGLKLELKSQRQTIEIIKVINKKNTTDEHFLGYFSLFVLFSITFDLSKFCMLIVFILIIIMIGIVYVKNKLFYINPLLNLLGFNFYDIVYKTASDKEKQTTRIFFKGDLLLNKTYYIEIKDENFNFLEKIYK